MNQPNAQQLIRFTLEDFVTKPEAALRKIEEIPGVEFAFMLSQKVPRWKGKGFVKLQDGADSREVMTMMIVMSEVSGTNLMNGFVGAEFKIRDNAAGREELLKTIRSWPGVASVQVSDKPRAGNDFGFLHCPNVNPEGIVEQLKGLSQIELAHPFVGQSIGPRS